MPHQNAKAEGSSKSQKSQQAVLKTKMQKVL